MKIVPKLSFYGNGPELSEKCPIWPKTLLTTTAISSPLSSRTSMDAEPGMRPSCCHPLNPIILRDQPRP